MPLDLRPRVLGTDTGTISRLARERRVAVRYVRAGCGAKLTVIEGCEPPGPKYRLVPKRSRLATEAADAEGVLDLGLADPAPLVAAINERGKISVTIAHRNVLQVGADRPLRLDDFGGPSCAAATHAVAAIHLGAAKVADGADTLIDAGEPSACDVDDPIRPEDCDRPVRLELTPITAGARVPGAGEMVTVGEFELDRMEVSAGEYASCVSKKACAAPGHGVECTGGVLGLADHPINCISWFDARAYCKSVGKRLPTEAEWGTAAGESKFPWGDEWPPPADTGNFADEAAHEAHPFWRSIPDYDDGFVGTAPVDSFAGDDRLATQLAGNVAVWTANRHKNARVVRGSTFGHGRASEIETKWRDVYVPTTKSRYIGVRCAR